MRQYFIGVSIILALAGCASSAKLSDEEVAAKVTLHVSAPDITYQIDDQVFSVWPYTNTVAPDRHAVTLTIGTNFRTTVVCNTEAGHYYEVSSRSCNDEGLTIAAANVQKQKKEENAKAQQIEFKKKYAEYKQALATPQPQYSLGQMKRDIELNLRVSLENDPDNLLPEINRQLAPFLEADRKKREIQAAEYAKQQAENAKQQAIREAESKRVAKEQQELQEKLENERKARDRIKLAAFRKSITEGIETNCGPVIEVKAKLVKVSFAVANYGNEHWIRKDEVFPTGYGCRFYNGEYRPQAD